jgi:vacuolar-type H+-ATPase subunit H
MKIVNLIDEFEDMLDTAATVPVLGKTVVDKEEAFELLRDIKLSLPEEIKQAKLIKDERETILKDAETEYARRIEEANREHLALIDEHVITQKAVEKATKMLDDTEAHILELKLNTYDYVDKMLYDFQEKMRQLHSLDFTDMFSKFQAAFDTVNAKLETNREQIRDLAEKTQKAPHK